MAKRSKSSRITTATPVAKTETIVSTSAVAGEDTDKEQIAREPSTTVTPAPSTSTINEPVQQSQRDSGPVKRKVDQPPQSQPVSEVTQVQSATEATSTVTPVTPPPTKRPRLSSSSRTTVAARTTTADARAKARPAWIGAWEPCSEEELAAELFWKPSWTPQNYKHKDYAKRPSSAAATATAPTSATPSRKGKEPVNQASSSSSAAPEIAATVTTSAKPSRKGKEPVNQASSSSAAADIAATITTSARVQSSGYGRDREQDVPPPAQQSSGNGHHREQDVLPPAQQPPSSAPTASTLQSSLTPDVQSRHENVDRTFLSGILELNAGLSKVSLGLHLLYHPDNNYNDSDSARVSELLTRTHIVYRPHIQSLPMGHRRQPHPQLAPMTQEIRSVPQLKDLLRRRYHLRRWDPHRCLMCLIRRTCDGMNREG
ncbi:hypothetical protein BGZ83_003604 [Gryganskiella cystojenkinii]|nr:hypothetical protein BGZ83_003604 [Gryganskiella cystojenkinii]